LAIPDGRRFALEQRRRRAITRSASRFFSRPPSSEYADAMMRATGGSGAGNRSPSSAAGGDP